MESPRRNLPKAAKRYIYRLLFFYILGVLAIGVVSSIGLFLASYTNTLTDSTKRLT